MRLPRALVAVLAMVLLSLGCGSRSSPELAATADAGVHHRFGVSVTYPPPYALAQVSINSAASVTGGQVVSSSSTIALTGVSTQGWVTALWELYDYPSGWSTPSGWTLMSTGVIQYTGSGSSMNPPSFTLPTASSRWGKWAVRLTVNSGIDPTGNGPNVYTGAPNPRMVDTSLALSMYAPSNLRDMFAGENSQFGGTPAEAWVHDYKANLRTLDAFINSGGGGGGSGALSLEELGAAFGSPTYSNLANRVLLIDPTGGYTLTPVSGSMGGTANKGAWLRIQIMPGVTVSGTNYLYINPVSGGTIQQVITNQNVISTSQIQITASNQSGGSFSFFSDGGSPPNLYVLP